MEHPNFGRPFASQAFFAYLLLIFSELRGQFLSCNVNSNKKLLMIDSFGADSASTVNPLNCNYELFEGLSYEIY